MARPCFCKGLSSVGLAEAMRTWCLAQNMDSKLEISSLQGFDLNVSSAKAASLRLLLINRLQWESDLYPRLRYDIQSTPCLVASVQQVKTVQAEPGSHHPIYQIKFADGIGGVDEVPFLAVRSQYWIKVYRVLVQDLPTPITDPEQENSKAKGQSAAQEVLVRSWSLREYSSLQSRSRCTIFVAL